MYNLEVIPVRDTTNLTLDIISSVSQLYPLKLCLVKKKLNIPVFILKIYYFQLRFRFIYMNHLRNATEKNIRILLELYIF